MSNSTIPDCRKTRVLMLVTELQMGGAARVVRDVADALATHCDVYLAVFNAREGIDFPSKTPIISLGVEAASSAIGKIFRLFRRAVRVSRIKRELEIDICVSHLEGADYVNLLSRGREKIVFCVHGSKLRNHLMVGGRGLLRRKILIPWLYNRPDQVVTVSRGITDELASVGVSRRRLRVINNWLDVSPIRTMAAQPLSSEEKAIFGHEPVLITTGRLHPDKNQGALLEVLAKLRALRPVRLVVVGDGPLRETFAAKSEALGLRTFAAWRKTAIDSSYDVYFLGQRLNPFNLTAHADLFVLPSLSEGFPLAPCEALACGTPVVAADCPTGPREILAPGTSDPEKPISDSEVGEFGILMPLLQDAQTVDVWVDTLASFLDDESERKRLAEAGKRRIREFAPGRIIPRWIELIREIAGR